jgi:hypothetical protein
MKNPHEPKIGKELILFVVGSYFTHDLFNVAYMQIMRSNNMGGLKQTSSTNAIFFSIVQAKTC